MKYIYISIVLAYSVLLLSCSDYLDKYPMNGPSSETYPTTEAELLSLLNGIYGQNTNNVKDEMTLTMVLDGGTDIGYDRNAGPLQELANGSADTNNTMARDVWQNAYKVIGRCNFLLDNMNRAEENTDPAVYKRVRAEARFLRAYTYHYLNELYGGVPLVTKMINLEEAIMPRSSKKEVLDFVLQELQEAADDLPNAFGSGTGRAGRGAALAIRARAALYGGEWEIAYTDAKKVMDMTEFGLDDNYANLFTYSGQKSKEIIWAHQYLIAGKKYSSICGNYLSRNGKGTSNKVPSQSLVDSYQCIDGKDIDKSSIYDPKKPFENRDPRLSYTLAVPGSIFFGYQFETDKDSTKCWNYNTTPATRIANQDATNAYATFSGYCWRKYVDIADKAAPTHSELNATIIRYAEMPLIYAEAKIEHDKIDQSVYEAINNVRQRKSVEMPAIGSNLTQSELRSIVRKERLYEFAGEGFRWFDIRRWKIADKVMNGSFYGRRPKGLLSSAPAIDENGTPDYTNVANRGDMRIIEERKFNKKENRDYLWPIPERERTTNPTLTQNPGY